MSSALGLRVRAEPSIIEGAIDICEFYRDPGPSEHPVAGPHLQRQDAQDTFDRFREYARDDPGFPGFRDEDLAAPAYSTLTVTEAMVAAFVANKYLEVHVLLEHFGQPPDQARLAALRLMRQAIAAANDKQAA